MKKADRRILRTQNALRTAMIELIIENGYETINISEIAERANVGRSTFYAHFADKDDLLQGSIELLKGRLEAVIEERRADGTTSSHPALAFCLPMFEHADEHRELVTAMLGRRGGQLMTELIHDMWANFVRNSWPQGDELEVQALVGAFGSVLLWWLTNEQKTTPLMIDKRFAAFAEGTLVREKVPNKSPKVS